MIIQLEKDLPQAKTIQIREALAGYNYKVTEVDTGKAVYLVCIGNSEADIRLLGALPGVKDVHVVSDSYKLVSRKWKTGTCAVDIGDVRIGAGGCSLMAGPCSIESEEQVMSVIQHLLDNNIRIMRGGVFKPRSSPYAFRGLGIEGLKMFSGLCRANGIRIITEVMEVAQIEQMYDYIDIFQVGARNSQNFNLLDALGKADKPVMIKRGISGTIDELLYAAEYVFSGGNEQLMLCERGIRTYETACRNTFDINAIPVLKARTHLPVIADPSHGVGVRSFVPAVALAAIAAGADGLIYEVHQKPEAAFSDGMQTLDFQESAALISRINKLQSVLQAH